MPRSALVLALLVTFEGCTRTAPAKGEAIICVDTDMPAPFATRLRIDVFAEDGRWLDTRDIAPPRRESWPASFSVFASDPSKDAVALVRLRAYPDGATRDYRGERFVDRSTFQDPLKSATPDATDGPRLVRGGMDITPAAEPIPEATIDRLVSVRLRYGVRGRVVIVLHGACVGTMASLEGKQTCTDREGTLGPVADEPLDPVLATPAPIDRSFRYDAPCTAPPRARGTAMDGTPLYDEEVCVPGGMFLFGGEDGFGFGRGSTWPERVAIQPPFRMDKYEVTVARWREARAKGFIPPDSTPLSNNGPLVVTTDVSAATVCTFSDSPMGREDYPLTCVSRTTARAFCKFLGGDLPGEVQWEWVTTAVGRPVKTRYPWGNEEPSCERTTWGRGVGVGVADNQCNPMKTAFGPRQVWFDEHPNGDVSIALGIVGLGGNVAEHTRDAYVPLDAACWEGAPLLSPGCDVMADAYANRGGLWTGFGSQLWSTLRGQSDSIIPSTDIGFRCVRSAP